MHRKKIPTPGRGGAVRRLALSGAVAVAAALSLPSAALAFYHGDDQGARPAAKAPDGSAAIVVDLNDRLRFDPVEIRVDVGDTVEWRNVGSIAHTVTADPARVGNRRNVELPDGAKPFDSGWVRKGQAFRYKFTEPGLYRYVCLPHERAKMLGTVIVG